MNIKQIHFTDHIKYILENENVAIGYIDIIKENQRYDAHDKQFEFIGRFSTVKEAEERILEDYYKAR